MMIRRTKIFYALVLCCMATVHLNAQEFTCVGIILDAKDSTVISYVTIRSESLVDSSDEEGRFTTSLGDSIVFYHIGFEMLVIYPTQCNDLDTVYMTPLSVEINDVVITSERVIHEVEQKKSFRIKSFGIFRPNQLIVHSKAYLSKHHQLQLFDSNGERLSQLDIKADMEEMIETCDGQFYLVDEKYAYYIGHQDEGLYLDSKQELSVFHRRYSNCVYGDEEEMIFKFTQSNNLVTDFFLISENKETIHFPQIKDDELLKALNKDDGTIARSKKPESKWQQFRTSKQKRAYLHRLFLGDFLNNVMYKNQYGHNYALAKDSSYYIFNYQFDSLHVYDRNGIPVVDYDFNYDNPQILFMNYERNKIFSLCKKGLHNYTLYIFNDKHEFQKLLTFESSDISDMAVVGNKVFYLRRSSDTGSKHAVLCFEDL